MTNKMTNNKKLWIGIALLILLSPLGLIIPKLFGAEGAWGEWGLEDIEKIAGFVPEGMKRLGELWKAPLPDYALPSEGKGLAGKSLEYIFSAIVGIACIAGVMYLLTKVLIRKNGGSQ